MLRATAEQLLKEVSRVGGTTEASLVDADFVLLIPEFADEPESTQLLAKFLCRQIIFYKLARNTKTVCVLTTSLVSEFIFISMARYQNLVSQLSDGIEHRLATTGQIKSYEKEEKGKTVLEIVQTVH